MVLFFPGDIMQNIQQLDTNSGTALGFFFHLLFLNTPSALVKPEKKGRRFLPILQQNLS